jgi:hypothetical protein
MLDTRLDLSQSPIKIPERFHQVRYDYERYPGTPGVLGLVGGANCQQYAYELLRAFGHSHQARIQNKEGVWYINPGSIGPRRFKLPMALVKLWCEAAAFVPELIELPN